MTSRGWTGARFPGGALSAALALGLPALALAEGGTPAAPCRTAACAAQLELRVTEATWRSRERFYPNNERIFVRVTAAGRRLEPVGAAGPGRCRRTMRGGGVRAEVQVCGTATPVFLRARRFADRPVELQIVYRGRPFLDGPDSSGGVAGPRTPTSGGGVAAP